MLVLLPCRSGGIDKGMRYGSESHSTAIDILKKRDWAYIRELAYFGSLGLQVALSIFIGYGVGRYLDTRYESGPWLTSSFFLIGVAAAVRNIGLAIRKIRKF